MSGTSERATGISAVKLALLARQMRTTVEGIELLQSEPIAVTGMSCRFPAGANNPEAFWQLLREGRDAVREVPGERWDPGLLSLPGLDEQTKKSISWGGFIDQVDQFDPYFFGIAPREAEGMDPQQRILLEVAWEGLERAGQTPHMLAGSKTGVFIAIYHNDYSSLLNSLDNLDAYSVSGNAHSLAANRLSYFLDLRGPSMAVDTACSSSLVTTHLACQSLRNGECNLALTGGVSLMLSPAATIGMSRWGMLARDGRCKTFDERADGFVRGEGCGVMVLKRLSDALADGDPILALIRGSALNQDGRTSGVTAPNGLSQQSVIRAALANAHVTPEQISYIEVHGTGTSLGDPIEVEALVEVIGQPQAQMEGQVCLLGSVKTNIGHLEASAGIAGMIKTILALQHEELPPHLHFNKLNPYISLNNAPFVIPTQLYPWPRSNKSRFAGVSSFGMGGTNAHIILEEAPSLPQPSRTVAPQADQSYLVPLSARSLPALQAHAKNYAHWLRTHAEVSTSNIAATASLRRSHFEHRIALVGDSAQALAEQANSFLRGELQAGLTQTTRRRKLVFVFPGQGAQWIGMGQYFLEHEAVFREQMRLCDEVLRQYVSWSLLKELVAPSEKSRLDKTEIAQPVMFALQVSLAALWRSWGVTPNAVVGHSVGEVSAAYVAGALSLEDSLRLVALRGRMVQEVIGQGGEMASIGLHIAKLEPLLRDYTERVDIAAYNSPTSTILSGEREALEEIVTLLQQRDIFSRCLNIGYASHCAQMTPFQIRLRQELSQGPGWQPQALTIPVFSTVLERQVQGQELDATYWGRNLREPVRFVSTIQRMLSDGYDTFIELSSHPQLTRSIQEIADTVSMQANTAPVGENEKYACIVVSSLYREKDERTMLLQALGTLYTHGVTVDWAALYPQKSRYVDLPTYPFQHQRYWLNTGSSGLPRPPSISGDPVQSAHIHSLLRIHTTSSLQPKTHYWDGIVSLATTPYLASHRIQGVAVLPGAVYLEAALSAAWAVYSNTRPVLEQVELKQLLILPDRGAEELPGERHLQLVLQPEGPTVHNHSGTQSLQFLFNSQAQELVEKGESQWATHATGLIRLDVSPPIHDPDQGNIAAIQARCPLLSSATEQYFALAASGLEYGPHFQGITQVWQGHGEALAQLRLPDELVMEAESYLLHPALLDACLQVIAAAVPSQRNSALKDDVMYLPTGFDRVQLTRHVNGHEQLWSHVTLRQVSEDAHNNAAVQQSTDNVLLRADISVYDAQGVLILQIEGLQVQRLAPHMLINQLTQLEDGRDWLYTLQWQHLPIVPVSKKFNGPGTWLLLVEESNTGIGLRLQEQLNEQGEHCICVRPGPSFAMLGKDSYSVHPDNLADFQQLLHQVNASEAPSCRGIIHLWSLIDATPTQTVDLASINKIQQRIHNSILHLMQALTQINWLHVPRLWLVTQGAIVPGPTGKEVAGPAVAQASLWGLGRTLAYEHPEYHCTCVDLSPVASADAEITTLQTLCLGEELENQMVLRGNQRYVARLERVASTPQVESRVVRANSTYLITGGLGGLGIQVARWLAERGAQYLVLVSRQEPTATSEPLLQALRERGTQVLTLAADVAAEVDVARVLSYMRQSGLPPLRGIVHAAGVLDDGVLLQQNAQRFARVLAPKVAGAWHLHQQTQAEQLDWFVLFSSAAAVLGSPGQANYAAANAFLDALAQQRVAQGLPTLSINWGPWSDVGQAASQSNRGERMARQGMASISPDRGIAILEQLLSQQLAGIALPQVAVLPLDLHYWRHIQIEIPLLQHLLQENAKMAQQSSSQQAVSAVLRQSLLTADPQECRRIIETYLCSQGAAILGIAADTLDIRLPLSNLGLDSLMGLEFKSRIERDLAVNIPVMKLLQGPSLVQLTTIILSELDRDQHAEATTHTDVPAYLQPQLPLVAIQPHGSNTPFFCIHGAMGYVLAYADLARHLGLEQPFYGLQALGLESEQEPLNQVEAMATRYLMAIRSIQPHGPYLLGGASFGGIIAFEMACQLQTQGEEVALLALIDSIKPTRDHAQDGIVSDVDDIRVLVDSAKFIGYFFGSNPAVSHADLSLLSPDERIPYIVSVYQQSHSWPASLGFEQVSNMLRVLNAILQANNNYIPQLYSNRITFFRATEGLPEGLLPPEFPRGDLAAGWVECSTEPLEIFDIPGDHVTMAKEPHVQVMAEKLRACIQQAKENYQRKESVHHYGL